MTQGWARPSGAGGEPGPARAAAPKTLPDREDEFAAGRLVWKT